MEQPRQIIRFPQLTEQDVEQANQGWLQVVHSTDANASEVVLRNNYVLAIAAIFEAAGEQQFAQQLRSSPLSFALLQRHYEGSQVSFAEFCQAVKQHGRGSHS